MSRCSARIRDSPTCGERGDKRLAGPSRYGSDRRGLSVCVESRRLMFVLGVLERRVEAFQNVAGCRLQLEPLRDRLQSIDMID